MKLQTKIILLVTGFMTLTVIIAGGALLYFQYRNMEGHFERSAFSLARAVLGSLENDMLDAKPAHIQEAVERIATSPGINEVVIFNRQGKIAASGEKSEVGKIDDDDKIQKVISTGNPLARTEIKYGASELCVLLPVFKKPVCERCHTSPEPILGVIEVGLSTAPLVEQLRDQSFLMGGNILLGLLALTLLMAFVFKQMITNRLSRLSLMTARVADGDYTVRMSEKGKDEIATLTRSFDNMTGRLGERTQELNALQRELEERVLKRTAELSETRNYLRVILDSMSDQVIGIDKNFSVTLVNRALTDQTGWEESKALGHYCYEISHGWSEPCSTKGEKCPLKTVLDTGKAAMVIHRHATLNGIMRYMEIAATPVRDRQGNIIEVLEIIRDITEREETSKKIAQHARYLEGISDMATAVAGSLDTYNIMQASLESMVVVMEAAAGALFESSDKGGWRLKSDYRLSPAIVAELSAKAVATGVPFNEQNEDRLITGVISDFPDPLLRHLFLQDGFEGFLTLYPQGSREMVCLLTRPVHVWSAEEIDTLRAIFRHMTMALENANLYQEAQEKERVRGELIGKLVTAQEEERKRIARELHDEVVQGLTGVAVNCVSSAHNLPQRLKKEKASFMATRELALETLQNVRRLIGQLRPPTLDDLGLPASLRWMIGERLKGTGIQADLDISDIPSRPNPYAELALYRVTQEAINNAVRHSGATHIWVRLKVIEKEIILEISDNGHGFDTTKVLQTQKLGEGWGLMGMKERILALGGRLYIESQPGKGTRVQVSILLQEVK